LPAGAGLFGADRQTLFASALALHRSFSAAGAESIFGALGLLHRLPADSQLAGGFAETFGAAHDITYLTWSRQIFH
jgi:hypothetical protein